MGIMDTELVLHAKNFGPNLFLLLSDIKIVDECYFQTPFKICLIQNKKNVFVCKTNCETIAITALLNVLKTSCAKLIYTISSPLS